MRYRRVRPTSSQFERARVASSIQVSPNSLISGSTMLAVNTITARGHRWLCMSSCTPLRMVLRSSLPNRTIVSTGSVLAGM